MRSRSLFLKYAIPLVILSSGAVIASGLVEMFFSYQESKTALARVQHEKAVAAAVRIEQFARDLEHQIAWIAQAPWGPRGVTLDQRRLDSLRLLRQVPAITEVSHLDLTGHEQLRVSRLAMDVIGSGSDFSLDPKFTESRDRKTYFSPVYFRKESEPYMTIALAGSGENAGVVVAEANLKFIWDVVSGMKIGQGGHAYVVDANGRLIAHPDISLVLQNTDLSSLALVRAATRQGVTNGAPVEAITGKDVQGREVLSASAPVAALGWTVFVDLPLREAFAPLYSSLIRTGVLLLVGLGISVLASLVLVRRMIAPIHVLQTGAARIGAGALDQRIEVKTGDELQALGDEFNRMAERLQESYSGLERKVEERTRDLREALEQQTATSEILRVISSSPHDLTPVLDAVAENAARLCDARDAVILRVFGDKLSVVAQHGTQHQNSIGEEVPIRRDHVTGRAVADRAIVHIPDVLAQSNAEFSSAREFALRYDYRSLLVVPMLREGIAIGAIAIRRREVAAFTEKQINLLKTFADQAVIAIENTRLFKELEERNTALTEALEQQTATSEILRVISSSPTNLQPVLDAVAENAGRLCDGDTVAILRVQGNGLKLAAAWGSLPALRTDEIIPIRREFINGRAILERKVVHVPDYQAESNEEFGEAKAYAARLGFKAALSAPMLREDSPIGVILVERAEARAFSGKQIEMLQTFADQAVIAIENVRLFNETKEALEQQTATAEVLEVISSSVADTQPVFDKILQSCRKLFDSSEQGIVLVTPQGHVTLAAHDGPALENLREIYDGAKVSAEPYVEGILRGRPIHFINTLDPDVHWTVRSVAERLQMGPYSQVFAPMTWEGEAVGFLYAIRRPATGFSGKEIALLETFADQAVIAIQNARLFQELQSRTHELAASVEQMRSLAAVSQTVNSTLDLDRVLSTIVEEAVHLSSADGGAVYEFNDATGEFRPRATHGFPPELVDLLLATPLRKGEGATGRAAQNRAPVQIPDLRAEGAYTGPLQKATMQAGALAVLAVPLMREERILGSLVVSRNSVGEFPAEIVDLLQTFAAQSTLAIQNARLFHEIGQKGRELEIASQHKSQFLANMSHELRTPLNAILGYTELIVDGIYGKVPAKIRAVEERVQKSGRHLLGLINDVLDLSKIEAGQLVLGLSDYSLGDVVQTVLTSVESLAAEKGLQLSADVAVDLPVGRGDERRITQVLLNLVGNAIKFTDKGRVLVNVTADDGKFAISVQDTGPGIPVAEQDRIFEEFRQVDSSATRAKGGTGLGLAIARRIVDLHRGRIWVESAVGNGSTFFVSIPVKADLQGGAS